MTTKSKPSTTVANPIKSEVVTNEVPDYIKKGSGRGSEEVSTNDMVLPRLEIVQALSPIKELNPDAREGMLFNSVTQTIYGDHVYFIPVYFRVEHLIWKAQSEGGGFFGSFPTNEQAQVRLNEEVANGESVDDLEIVDTPVHFGLLVDPDTNNVEQVVVSMAKTKAKVSRKFNALIQIVGGDRFARVYKISSYTDENKKGQKYKNFAVQPAGYPAKEAYHKAEALYEMFRLGTVKADHAAATGSDDTSSDRGDM